VSTYYNEFDPYAAAWLRELMRRRLIPDGCVDERDVRVVLPDDLREFTQLHFFAGIGGWAHALRLAGWPDDRPVLTGSPPCQPFSTAGKQQGVLDERHLAPVWLGLVAALRPPVIFGEQVASAVTKDNWLDDLLDALEAEGYATGAAVLPACSIGAPHIRSRLWFTGRMADASVDRPQGWVRRGTDAAWEAVDGSAGLGSTDLGLADTDDGCKGVERGSSSEMGGWGQGHARAGRGCSSSDGRMADASGERRQQVAGGALGDEAKDGRAGWDGSIANSDHEFAGDGTNSRSGQTDDQWRDPDWLFCRDEKWRPVESGTFPLAHGVSSRVGRLRGYGNAIVPQVAAQIIKTIMESHA